MTRIEGMTKNWATEGRQSARQENGVRATQDAF